jgi:quercetin dioxygenase-like cupin family protein
VRTHSDNRRTFYGDIFDTTEGDINVVYLAKDVPIAWHRHQRQSDWLFLISGVLEVQTIYVNGDRCRDMLKGSNKLLYIPHNVWHGYEALDHGTVVLQFNGPGKWDGTDEERHDIGEAPWDW